MDSITIIVVAFNRLESLKRLLKSLQKVEYLGEKVKLHISIDQAMEPNEENEKVKQYAKDFTWEFGKKVVDVKEKNLGLKEHVLQCGNLTKQYENIIVLEDDLIVSPMLYQYAKQVITYYKGEENIAGFALYSFQRNQLNVQPFYPLEDGSDVYFAQYACSWGQIWTKDRWKQFMDWYEKSDKEDFSNPNMPSYVGTWKSSSWLKHHIKYVVETNKFFVYPRVGLTTNFTEKGTHNQIKSFAYQCSLYAQGMNIEYRFSKLQQSKSVYDAFFENIKMAEILNIPKSVECDLFGKKNLKEIKKKRLLSTNIYPYEVIKSYSLEMYPYEQNIINAIQGEDIFLYNLEKQTINNRKKKENKILRYSYKIDNMSRKDIKELVKYFVQDLIIRWKNKLNNKG